MKVMRREVVNENSWKQSFESIYRELEVANRKKNSLDDLLARNRVSKPTYEYLLRNLDEEISKLEAHLKSLTKSMSKRINELQKQIKLFEVFFANFELLHIGFEVDEETYARQREIMIKGMVASKKEMEEIENALKKIGGK
ncbi:hypothetical protein CW706_00130 [Candidatus Bathyarchaeota archaeon]|nr:MAG: hypothetical protein CW706_00130 [Candidatus Bathyarchaeota archaeon]